MQVIIKLTDFQLHLIFCKISAKDLLEKGLCAFNSCLAYSPKVMTAPTNMYCLQTPYVVLPGILQYIWPFKSAFFPDGGHCVDFFHLKKKYITLWGPFTLNPSKARERPKKKSSLWLENRFTPQVSAGSSSLHFSTCIYKYDQRPILSQGRAVSDRAFISENPRQEIPRLKLLCWTLNPSQLQGNCRIVEPDLGEKRTSQRGSQHHIKIHDVSLTLDEFHISSQLPNSSQRSWTHPGASERGRRLSRGSWGAGGGSPLHSGSPWRKPGAGLYLSVEKQTKT